MQRILHLKKSPDFPEQLAKLLDEKDFGNATQTLRGEHLATLIDGLDEVCLRMSPSPSAYRQPSSSVPLTPLVPFFRGVYESLDGYAAPGRFYRNPT